MQAQRKAVKCKVTREEAAARIELGVELKKKKEKAEREKINSSSLLEAGGIESRV